MAAKAEIGWKGRTADGDKREVYAHHMGGHWIFRERGKRYDQWTEMPDPPLEDWLELLDAVERLVNRRRQRPEEPDRIRKMIRERFPDAKI